MWVEGRFPVPNLSTGYHGILKRWWETYGLGKVCLIIGEGKSSKEFFSNYYPKVEFITSDVSEEVSPDYIWDICRRPPRDLWWSYKGRVDSIICQAVFEHIIDPVEAMRNFSFLLSVQGRIFIHTHPMFMEHHHPIDCLRYLSGWFEHLSDYITDLKLKDLHVGTDHIFACYVKA